MAPGPAKAQPVYYSSIIENPPSLTLLGEQQKTHHKQLRREAEPGFGICAPRALEIRSRF